MPSRVVQVIRHLAHRDGVSEIVRGFTQLLIARGGERSILVESADGGLDGETRSLTQVSWRPEDVAIVHVAGATGLGPFLAHCPARKAIFFHNITPPELLFPGTRLHAQCRVGWEELRWLAALADVWLAESAFNLDQLAARTGLERPRFVVPPVIDAAAERERPADPARLHALRAGGERNVLFVGRLVPNKRQAWLMEVFDCLHRFAPRTRLHLVGDATGNELYLLALARLRARLASGGAIEMPGKVSDAELAAYYRTADLFLCLSEHEGFCLPPLVAAAHGVPVLARAAAAIPETVGPAAALVHDYDAARIAELSALMLDDPGLRAALAAAAAAHLRRFTPEAVGAAWDGALAALRS